MKKCKMPRPRVAHGLRVKKTDNKQVNRKTRKYAEGEKWLSAGSGVDWQRGLRGPGRWEPAVHVAERRGPRDAEPRVGGPGVGASLSGPQYSEEVVGPSGRSKRGRGRRWNNGTEEVTAGTEAAGGMITFRIYLKVVQWARLSSLDVDVEKMS